ncbi:MAG: molybdate ABC transporter substrate-binding protein [Gammaproteobacteria bacterium]
MAAALAVAAAGAGPVLAAPAVTVAVASNFGSTARALAKEFTRNSDLEVNVTTGSSGKFYAQIEHGAPFDIFLSADAERPEQLEQKGFAGPGTRFTYAIGKMVLFSADASLKDQDCKAALAAGKFRHLAIANPKVAPYGVAAMSVLAGLGLGADQLGERLVLGENISQTLQFVATGSAQLGFVALSQMIGKDAPASTCRWDVPPELHAPIVQQAVLLKRAAGNRTARDFYEFLRSGAARQLIRNDGYDVGP